MDTSSSLFWNFFLIYIPNLGHYNCLRFFFYKKACITFSDTPTTMGYLIVRAVESSIFSELVALAADCLVWEISSGCSLLLSSFVYFMSSWCSMTVESSGRTLLLEVMGWNCSINLNIFFRRLSILLLI
jgi:hypothetical protein